jgi:hypothetical protein
MNRKEYSSHRQKSWLTGFHTELKAPAYYEMLHKKMSNICKVFIEKRERKKLFGRPRHRWKDNIGTGLTEIEWADVDYIHLAQERGQW